MSLQKYRATSSLPQSDGSTLWYAHWMGGNSLAKVTNCRLFGLAGDMRRTVYITGEPDTYFSQPAKAVIHGVVITGYVGGDECGDNIVFHHGYY